MSDSSNLGGEQPDSSAKPCNEVENSEGDADKPAEQKPNFYLPALETGAADPGASNLPPALRELQEAADKVDKTKLDQDALRDMAVSAKSELEARIRDELASRPLEPHKPSPCIANYRMAARCSATCETSYKGEKVSFCQRCKLRVYDLNGLDDTEAQQLVFKMEGRQDAALFKRADGKFLTSNCPVGQSILLSRMVGGAFSAAALAAIFLVPLLQPPEPKTLVAQVDDGQKTEHQIPIHSSAVHKGKQIDSHGPDTISTRELSDKENFFSAQNQAKMVNLTTVPIAQNIDQPTPVGANLPNQPTPGQLPPPVLPGSNQAIYENPPVSVSPAGNLPGSEQPPATNSPAPQPASSSASTPQTTKPDTPSGASESQYVKNYR